MTPQFVTMSLALLFPIPTYIRWWPTSIHAPRYRWHEKVLGCAIRGVRGRWQLRARSTDGRSKHSVAHIRAHSSHPSGSGDVRPRRRRHGRAFGETSEEAVRGEFGSLWADARAMGYGILDFRPGTATTAS